MAASRRLDTLLVIVIVALVVGVLALGGWFGYSVYSDRKAAEDAVPALRLAKVIQAQVKKSPNDVILRVRLGEAYASAGRPQEAIEQFNSALKIDPKHTGAYLDLAIVAVANKKPDEARGYFKKVIELTDGAEMANIDERREQAFYNLGLLEFNQRNYEDAVANFKAALRIKNNASDTYFYLAESLDALGQPEDARNAVATGLRFDPNFAQAHYLLGKLFLAQGEKVNAAIELGKAMQLSPDAAEPRTAAEKLGDPAKLMIQAKADEVANPSAALEAAGIAFGLEPENVEAGKLKGRLLEKQGSKTEAYNAYLSVAAIAPKDPEVKAALKRLKPKTKTSGN